MHDDHLITLLGNATTWTGDIRSQVCWRIGLLFKDKNQIARLLSVAGHPELVAHIPEHTGAGTVAEHGVMVGRLIDRGATPQTLLGAYTQVVDETIAANDALNTWLKQHAGSLDLRRELGLIGRLIEPDFDSDGTPDGDDYKDTHWYPALVRLIARVRDEARLGGTVLTPEELDVQVAEFKRRYATSEQGTDGPGRTKP